MGGSAVSRSWPEKDESHGGFVGFANLEAEADDAE